MATSTKTAGSAWGAAAQGPGVAYLTMQDHTGYWIIHTAADASALALDGHPAHRALPQAITLETGEYLQVRGRGVYLITAATVL